MKITSNIANSVESFFQEKKYKLTSFPNSDLFAFDEYHYDSTHFPPKDKSFLNKFLNKPIIIENELNNDIYQVYYNLTTYNTFNYYKEQYSKKWEFNIRISNFLNLFFQFDEQNNDISLKPNPDNTPEQEFYIELVKKGARFGITGEVISENDLKYSEFEKFEKFDDIDAPDYSVIYSENPQVSEVTYFNGIDSLSEQQLKDSIEKLEKEDTTLIELLKAKEDGTLKSAMWTIDEVDNIYNINLSNDDKRAWVIYLQNKAKKKLEGDFIKKYDSEYPANPETILELMKKGSLFFDPNSKVGERLQPKSVYRAGNIWLKRSSLDNDKQIYITRFGEDLYELHKETIKDIWIKTWDNRLKLTAIDKSQKLVLLPISALAETFKIESFINIKDRSKKIDNIVVGIKRIKGEVIEDIKTLENFGNTDGNNTIQRNLINLKEAFVIWCKEAGSGNKSAEYGVQWSNTTKDIYDVINRYLKPIQNPFAKEKNGKLKWSRYKDDARKVGTRLFAQFLSDGLNKKDQQKIEIIFNSTYNFDVEIKLNEVPIGFTYKKYLDNKFLFVLRDSNLNAIRNYVYKGSIGLAYGVGLGKTFCSIFIMKQALDLGLVKRPIVIVPNQVYSQFINEISRGLGKDFNPNLGGKRINGFYNGQGELYNKLGNNAVDGINMCTYEATLNFVYDGKRIKGDWFLEASEILESGNENLTNEHRQEFEEKYSKTNFLDVFDINTDNSELINEVEDELVEEVKVDNDDFDDFDLLDEDDLVEFDEGGKIEEEVKTIKFPIFLNSESNDFDMVVVDEAHNFNALFSSIKAPPKENQSAEPSKKTKMLKISREINPYSEIRETGGGRESARAEKLWFLARFIQSKSLLNNTILLSATPFTNSPLQVFSMISYINYDILKNSEIGNLKDFFDVFAKIEFAEDFKTDLSIVKRNKLVGWRNVVALQKFVFYAFDKSSREEEDKAVTRPNKIVLPLKRTMIDGKLYEFDKENYVSTTIKMSSFQKQLWDVVRNYAGGKDNPITGNPITFEDIAKKESLNETSFITKTKKKKKEESENSNDEGNEIDIENPDDLVDGTIEAEKEKNNVKALQCLMWGRQITLNPYLYKWSGFKNEPTAKDYVEQSPKLLYAMLCIKSVKDYHSKSKDSPYMSGQVVYMNFGVKAFRLLRDYLVDELGFNYNEIGIISGKGNFIGKKLYPNKQDVADAFLGRVYNNKTKEYDSLSEDNRVKILIGSEAIKEGINLQNYASVLYNCFLDFNPTDTIQVEGRIWRQGNAFGNVRIVTPLISDSIDIFMFQKLEDKTERINQIWTRNGNANEIDTTSFNPADLKYELVTDATTIAQLEREYKKEQIDEEITEINEARSGLLSLKTIFISKNEILNKKIQSGKNYDYRCTMFIRIMQVRSDLLTKPLLNEEFYEEFLTKYCKEKELNFIKIYEMFPNIYSFIADYTKEEYYKRIIEKNNDENLFFNYSVEQLIGLMATLLKEQKIAFPNGYYPNWRELIPKEEIPIVEGDKVEYKTKKGVKKGICSDVRNEYGEDILSLFLDRNFDSEFYYNYVVLNKNKEELKEIDKLFILNDTYYKFKDTIRDTTNVIDETTLKILTSLLKQYYKYSFDNEIKLGNLWKPTILDVGEIEDMKIEDKEIKAITDESKKVVTKAKSTPPPFTFNNKKRDENLAEITEWVNKYYLKYKIKDLGYSNYSSHIPKNTFYINPIDLFFITNEINSYSKKDLLSILTGDGEFSFSVADYNSKEYVEETIANKLKNETWGNLIDSKFVKTLFNFDFTKVNNLYNIEFPAKLKEFDLAYEKRLKPMGIEKESELTTLIDEKQVEINSLRLVETELDNDEVFEELVQEVIRKQEALNSEEVRAGSTFIKRAESFAKSNPDYKGNELLSIFRKDIADKKIKEVEEVEKIEEVEETTKESINDEISALSDLINIYEENDKEYIELKEIIDGLTELKDILD